MTPQTVVLLIDDLSEWTGTEVHLLRLLQRLDPHRVRAVVAVVGRYDLATQFGADGVQVEPLHIHRALALSGLQGVGRIATLLRRERASLLVTYHTAADLLGPLAGRLAGVPVISCRRDEGFTKKPIHVRLQRPLNRLLQGMISVSHSVVRAVERAEGYPGRLQQVIWNGEDLTRFAPGDAPVRAELGLGPETCVVASVSLLSEVKDHQTQLEAFSRLLRTQPDCCLLVAGDGPMRRELERQAEPLGSAVRFLGHRKDVPQLLRACDIFLQTSLSEGFSNAILQAMACAAPVVVTAVGGNPELVTADCGYLVEVKDPQTVAGHLGELAGSRRLRRELGAAGRRRAEAYCSLEVMVETYTDAFARAADGRFPGPSSGV